MMRMTASLGTPETMIISLVEDALSKDMYYILVSFLSRYDTIQRSEGSIIHASTRAKLQDGSNSEPPLSGQEPWAWCHTLKHSLYFLETFSKSKSRQERDRGDGTVWAR